MKKNKYITILFVLLIVSQIYLFYKIYTQNRFDTLILENLEIRNSKNIKMCEIVNGNKLIFYNLHGNKLLELGETGFENGGGIKLYNRSGKIATYLDGRIINSYSNDSTYSSSIGKDMKNSGFIALFDSSGRVFYLKKN